MHRKPVREIMRSPVVSIHPELLVADAAQVMEEFDIRRLPVVDEEEGLVGIVTDGDVAEAESAGSVLSAYDPEAPSTWLAVAEIMTRPVITIGPDASVGQLAQLLLTHRIGGVPVVEPDREDPRRLNVVGIVTEMDIFRMIAQAWETETAQA